jgi:hypothetical protein
MLDPKGEGDDATGYREKVEMLGGTTMTVFVVKEDGQYKVLDTLDKPNSIALEMVDRVNAGDLKGAKALLDWMREDQHLGGRRRSAGRAGVSAFLDQGRSGRCAQDEAGRGGHHGWHQADGRGWGRNP